VGLGAQDSLEEAQAFVRDHGVRSPRMLYDASRDSWRELGISGQPAAILLAGNGAEVRRWFGPMDFAEVLAAARGE